MQTSLMGKIAQRIAAIHNPDIVRTFSAHYPYIVMALYEHKKTRFALVQAMSFIKLRIYLML